MQNDTALIVSEKPLLPELKLSSVALQLRDKALESAALVAKVENASQNEVAVRAQQNLDQIAKAFEKSRKQFKEPYLEAGRAIDRTVNQELLEVEKEIGRIKNLRDDFQLAERRRMAEEEEMQRRELARIEREKQAELTRIAVEQANREAAARAAQAEIDRKAREASEAAAKLIADAKNKEQREAAEKAKIEADKQKEVARIESEKQAEILKEQNKLAAEASLKIQEAAAAAAYAEAKPITSTRTVGEVIKEDWNITVTNPYELAKFHPDCVKIEPLLTPIKNALNAGITVKGVRAEKKINSSVRSKPLQTIDV